MLQVWIACVVLYLLLKEFIHKSMTCIIGMFQPPWDLNVENKFIIHYTYGCDYNMKVSSFSLMQLWCESKVEKLCFCGQYYFCSFAYVCPCIKCESCMLSCFMCKVFTPYYFIQGELTYGKIGEWRFDKRSYLLGPPPKNLPLPPPGVPESVVSACFKFFGSIALKLLIKVILIS